MVKLVVKQPGFFVAIHNVGSFRSPFKVKIPESLKSLVETVLLKNGIKDFEFSPIEPKVVKKKIERTENKVNVDLSEVLKRLDDIQSLVNKVLQKDPSIIIHQDGILSQDKKRQEEEQEMFIPSLSDKNSSIELSVKTAEKEDVSDRVESLSKLKRKPRR
jgi:hypothetical protein